MTNMKTLLNNYREKLILLKATIDNIGAMTDDEIIDSIELKKDIAELEELIKENKE